MKQMYDQQDIATLLARFMDGTTTLEEEDLLARYFREGDIPAEWEPYRLLFAELEDMKAAPAIPTATPLTATALTATPRLASRRWLRWVAAAAVVAGVLFAATQSQPTEQPQMLADANRPDTTDVLRPEPPNQEVAPDTTALRRMLEQRQPAPAKRRRLRKPEPTITDYDKGYALLAQAQQECEEAEQQMAQAQQDIIRARLTAAGYVAIQLEDGTIIYIDEPKEYFAYEE